MNRSSDAPAAQDRVLHVLATLAQCSGPVTASALIQLTGLPRSSLYRQLTRLKQWGFVQESNGVYAPGPMGLQLAHGFDLTSGLVRTAKPELQWLVAQSGESAGLIVAVNERAICLEMQDSPQALRCSFEKGRSVPLIKGATAKCLLAHLAAARRDAVMKGWSTLPPDAQRPDAVALEQIRAAGFAVSSNEVDEGVWGASAPLVGQGKRLLGCVTLMAPVARAQSRERDLIDLVVLSAARMSRQLSST